MNPEIVVAIVGALVAILTAVITNHLTKRSQLKFEERKLKEEYYTNYVKAISNNVLMKDEHAELDDAQNRLILVGSSEVVRILMQFHDAIKISAPPINGEEHDKILTDLIKAMRADLYGTRKINDGYPTIHLSGLRSHGKKQ
jgi:hypothetical protein